jgi:hypothetical protein
MHSWVFLTVPTLRGSADRERPSLATRWDDDQQSGGGIVGDHFGFVTVLPSQVSREPEWAL